MSYPVLRWTFYSSFIAIVSLILAWWRRFFIAQNMALVTIVIAVSLIVIPLVKLLGDRTSFPTKYTLFIFPPLIIWFFDSRQNWRQETWRPQHKSLERIYSTSAYKLTVSIDHSSTVWSYIPKQAWSATPLYHEGMAAMCASRQIA